MPTRRAPRAFGGSRTGPMAPPKDWRGSGTAILPVRRREAASWSHRCRRRSPTWKVCRLPSSSWTRTTCCETKARPTPTNCVTPGFRLRPCVSTARSTTSCASTRCVTPSRLAQRSVSRSPHYGGLSAPSSASSRARPTGTCLGIQGEKVASPPAGTTGALDLPEYAPVPAIAKGPALNSRGYHVWQVERNLYAVTDNVYMSAFLTTPDGVVIFDAPPNIGHNIRRAVDEITAANGLTSQVTHMVYSHHHCDHQGASSLFGGDIVRIGHEETRRQLLRDDDPARPIPDVTFADRYTLEVGGERVELAWHGPNHTPDNIYIHFPGHDTLMFIDVVNAGWVPIYNLNLSEDVIGYMGAPDIALSYPWTHLISGHVGRLATRDDAAVHQQYIADIVASSREALASVNPVPFYVDAGENVWLGIKGHLNAVTERAAGPVIAKYTGGLAAP